MLFIFWSLVIMVRMRLANRICQTHSPVPCLPLPVSLVNHLAYAEASLALPP